MWNEKDAVIDDLNETIDFDVFDDIFKTLDIEKPLIEEKSLDELILKKAHEDTNWAASMAIKLMEITSKEISAMQEKVQIANERMRYADSMMRLP